MVQNVCVHVHMCVHKVYKQVSSLNSKWPGFHLCMFLKIKSFIYPPKTILWYVPPLTTILSSNFLNVS